LIANKELEINEKQILIAKTTVIYKHELTKVQISIQLQKPKMTVKEENHKLYTEM
jgi:hypothetical protein